MAESEKLQQLDRRIAQSVLAALSSLRSEISERLREHTDAVEEKLRTLEEVLPASFVVDEDIEPLAQAAAKSARQSAFGEVRQALSAIDRSTTQAEILSNLLECAGGFCSRSALFLTRKEEVRGWGAYGFADSESSPSDLSFDYAEGSPWGRLAASNGSIELSPADCAPLCSHLESAVPHRAVLVPIVLGDRLAAALYADRVDDDEEEGSFDLEALQSLAFVAALSIETLAFRERPQTPTLAVADDGAAAGAVSVLPLWGEEISTAQSAAAVVAQPYTEAEGQESEASVAEVAESEDAAPALAEPSFEVEAAEPAAEEAEEVETVAEGPGAGADPSHWLDRPGRRQETEEFTAVDHEDIEAASAAAADGSVVAEAAEQAASEEIGELPPVDGEVSTLPDSATVSDSEVSDSEVLEAPALDADLVTEEIPLVTQEEVAFDVSTAFDEGTAEITPAEDQGGAGVAPAAVEPIDVSEDETVLVQMPRLGEEPSSPVAAAVPEAPAKPAAPYRAPDDTLSGTGTGVRGGAAQVEPPSDVDGPGLAFRQASPGLSKAEDAVHDEGRRLARLLVSEIRLYYEDQVEEGRRNRDIYRRLKEDIDRSRRMYEERIDEKVSQSRDYFQEELVRILADGDEGALGL